MSATTAQGRGQLVEGPASQTQANQMMLHLPARRQRPDLEPRPHGAQPTLEARGDLRRRREGPRHRPRDLAHHRAQEDGARVQELAGEERGAQRRGALRLPLGAVLAPVGVFELRGLPGRGEEDVRAAEQQLAIDKSNKRLDVLYTQRVESATANWEAARSTLRLAQIALENATIRAPFSGRISGKPLQPGTYVAPGVEVARIVGTGGAYFEAEVPESQVATVQPGMSVEVSIDALGDAITWSEPAMYNVQIKKPADDNSTYKYFAFYENGVPRYYTFGVVADERALAKDKGALARRYLAAWMKGQDWAFKNQKEAVELMRKHIPELNAAEAAANRSR